MPENLPSRTAFLRVLGLVVLVVAFVAVVATGTAATTLPGCQWCHFKDATFRSATLAATHAKTPCISCHVPRSDPLRRATFGLYEAAGMWVPLLDPSGTSVTDASDGACLTCHARVEKTVTQSGGLRIRHETCATANRCVDCHSDVGHGSATAWNTGYSMNDCVACHREQRAPLQCTSCHVGRIQPARFSKPEFAVTHGANWRQTHGMGQMSACSVCHSSDACSRCHGPGVPHATGFITDHGATSLQKGAKCTTCHSAAFCLDCHGTEMPHAKTFAARHSGIVSENGRGPCLRCHAISDCNDCHVKHVHPGGAVGGTPLPSKVTTQ